MRLWGTVLSKEGMKQGRKEGRKEGRKKMCTIDSKTSAPDLCVEIVQATPDEMPTRYNLRDA